MRRALKPEDIANEISMLSSIDGGAILAVEGVTDSRLYGKFLYDNVKIVVGHSKSNVRRAVDECWNNREIKNVVGIVDADLDRIVGRKRTPPIFSTDQRDLETMLLSSPALDDILAEYADNEALEAFTEEYGPVYEAILSACYPIGLMMYVSEKYKLSLNFRNLDFRLLLDSRSLQMDEKKLLDEIVLCTAGRCIDRKELGRIYRNEASRNHDPIDYARGHDAVEVLLVGLKHNFGSFNSWNLKTGELSGALRLAFSDRYFSVTTLYKKTLNWSREYHFRLWSFERDF